MPLSPRLRRVRRVFQPLGFAAPESVNTLPSMFLLKKKKKKETVQESYFTMEASAGNIFPVRVRSQGRREEKENLVKLNAVHAILTSVTISAERLMVLASRIRTSLHRRIQHARRCQHPLLSCLQSHVSISCWLYKAFSSCLLFFPPFDSGWVHRQVVSPCQRNASPTSLCCTFTPKNTF